MKYKTAVETPAYGLNTPEGIDITASNLHFSSSNSLIFLCAFEFPNKTPSGTITAHLPPIERELYISSKNKSSVLLVLIVRSSDFSLSFIEPLNGGFARTKSYNPFSLYLFDNVSSPI